MQSAYFLCNSGFMCKMVDKLIRIVRIADLTPLAGVLSLQVLAFLRSFATSR